MCFKRMTADVKFLERKEEKERFKAREALGGGKMNNANPGGIREAPG
jgi:hypothetical protein